MAVTMKDADDCIRCGLCVEACPQEVPAVEWGPPGTLFSKKFCQSKRSGCKRRGPVVC